MSVKEPTREEMEQMFDTKTSIVAEIDGLTYQTLTNLSNSTGVPFETLAGRAVFLGIGPLLQEVRNVLNQK